MHLLSSVHEENSCTAAHHCTSIAAYCEYSCFERQCCAVCGTGARSGVACRDPETGVEAPHYRPADRAAYLQAAVEKRECGTGGALQPGHCGCGWGHSGTWSRPRQHYCTTPTATCMTLARRSSTLFASSIVFCCFHSVLRWVCISEGGGCATACILWVQVPVEQSCSMAKPSPALTTMGMGAHVQLPASPQCRPRRHPSHTDPQAAQKPRKLHRSHVNWPTAMNWVFVSRQRRLIPSGGVYMGHQSGAGNRWVWRCGERLKKERRICLASPGSSCDGRGV